MSCGDGFMSCYCVYFIVVVFLVVFSLFYWVMGLMNPAPYEKLAGLHTLAIGKPGGKEKAIRVPGEGVEASIWKGKTQLCSLLLD